MYKYDNDAIPMADAMDDVFHGDAAERRLRIYERLRRSDNIRYLSIDDVGELMGDNPLTGDHAAFDKLFSDMMKGKLKPDVRLKNAWLVSIINRSTYNAKALRQAFTRATLADYFGGPTGSELLDEWIASDYAEPYQAAKPDVRLLANNQQRAEYCTQALSRLIARGKKKPSRYDIYDYARRICAPADKPLFKPSNEELDRVFWDSPQRIGTISGVTA